MTSVHTEFSLLASITSDRTPGEEVMAWLPHPLPSSPLFLQTSLLWMKHSDEKDITEPLTEWWGALKAAEPGEKTHTAPSVMIQRPSVGKMLLKLGEIKHGSGLLRRMVSSGTGILMGQGYSRLVIGPEPSPSLPSWATAADLGPSSRGHTWVTDSSQHSGRAAWFGTIYLHLSSLRFKWNK